MASIIDIKRRKASVESTGQITKAMKLVSTVKLQRAKQRADESKAYFNKMYETISSILAKAGNINHPYLQENGSTKKGIITISSNRGLAGGYNNNIVKLIRDSGMNKEDIMIYAVGHKAMDTLKHRGYEIVSKNTVVHEPKLVKLLPIENDQQANEEKSESKAPMNFEPEPEEALSLLIPKYICSMIYGALVTSVASENGARMQAMDSATSNAEEMISNLELAYNRARQGAITQELTEIISGAEALK